MANDQGDNLMRLFLLLVDVVQDVLWKYFSSSILKGRSFTDYLENRKHKIYHLYNTSKCCLCGSTSESITYQNVLSRTQFLSLYQEKEKYKSHMKWHQGKTVQTCICQACPLQNITVEVLDITLCYSILRNCESIPHDEDQWINTIKTVRNNVVHFSDIKSINASDFTKNMQDLYGALRGISSKVSRELEIQTICKIGQIENCTIEQNDRLKSFLIILQWYQEKMVEKEILECKQRSYFRNTMMNINKDTHQTLEEIRKYHEFVESKIGNVTVKLRSYTSDSCDTESRQIREHQTPPKTTEDLTMTPILLYLQTPPKWDKSSFITIFNHLASAFTNSEANIRILSCATDELEIFAKIAKSILKDVNLTANDVTNILSEVLSKADINTCEEAQIDVSVHSTADNTQERMQFEKDGNLEEGNGIKETSLMLDITGDNINTLSLQNAEIQISAQLEKNSEELESKGAIHNHCASCFTEKCAYVIKGSDGCEMTSCKNCEKHLHACKLDDHTYVCSESIVPCINKENGCESKIHRSQMHAHMKTCPANVVVCQGRHGHVRRNDGKIANAFNCGGIFHREEFKWHYKNFGLDIVEDSLGTSIISCPYRASGCRFRVRKFSPDVPKSRLVFNRDRNCFGLSISDIDESRLLQTGSVINFEHIPEKAFNNIVAYLDNLSICSLNATSSKLRKMCQAFLGTRGVVVCAWTKGNCLKWQYELDNPMTEFRCFYCTNVRSRDFAELVDHCMSRRVQKIRPKNVGHNLDIWFKAL